MILQCRFDSYCRLQELSKGWVKQEQSYTRAEFSWQEQSYIRTTHILRPGVIGPDVAMSTSSHIDGSSQATTLPMERKIPVRSYLLDWPLMIWSWLSGNPSNLRYTCEWYGRDCPGIPRGGTHGEVSSIAYEWVIIRKLPSLVGNSNRYLNRERRGAYWGLDMLVG